PLGTGTSEAWSRMCQRDPENVSGTVLLITRGSERSLSSSPPLPLSSTEMAVGSCLIERPGGATTSSSSANNWVIGCWAATATYSVPEKNSAASLPGQ